MPRICAVMQRTAWMLLHRSAHAYRLTLTYLPAFKKAYTEAMRGKLYDLVAAAHGGETGKAHAATNAEEHFAEVSRISAK